MRTDPSPFRRLRDMLLRQARTIVLLVGLTGCSYEEPSFERCLEDRPWDRSCCKVEPHVPLHFDQGTCCLPGMHAIVDFEHSAWKACVWDEDAGAGAGSGLDAGFDAEVEAGADAP